MKGEAIRSRRAQKRGYFSTARPPLPAGKGDHRGVHQTEQGKPRDPRGPGIHRVHLPLPSPRQGQTDRAPRAQQGAEAEPDRRRPDRPGRRQLPPPRPAPDRRHLHGRIRRNGRGDRRRPEPRQAGDNQGVQPVQIRRPEAGRPRLLCYLTAQRAIKLPVPATEP